MVGVLGSNYNNKLYSSQILTEEMSYLTEVTELMSAILVGILFSIFISAFFILFLIIQRRTRYGIPYLTKQRKPNNSEKPEIQLLKPVSSNLQLDVSDVSLCDEMYDNMSNFNAVVQDDPLWAEKVSTLISHCMAVLMLCRNLTEKLTSIAMNSLDEWDPQMAKLVDLAKVITLRVDQFVNCMRPPLNPAILEARAASLTLAVTHLAIMTQYECNHEKIPAEWVSKLLNNIQMHIEKLNTATENYIQSNHNIEMIQNSWH